MVVGCSQMNNVRQLFSEVKMGLGLGTLDG